MAQHVLQTHVGIYLEDQHLTGNCLTFEKQPPQITVATTPRPNHSEHSTEGAAVGCLVTAFSIPTAACYATAGAATVATAGAAAPSVAACIALQGAECAGGALIGHFGTDMVEDHIQGKLDLDQVNIDVDHVNVNPSVVSVG